MTKTYSSILKTLTLMHPTALTSSQKGVFYEEQIYGNHVLLSGCTAA